MEKFKKLSKSDMKRITGADGGNAQCGDQCGGLVIAGTDIPIQSSDPDYICQASGCSICFNDQGGYGYGGVCMPLTWF